MLPDGSDSRMRALRYTGPGAVLVAVAHQREVSRMGAGSFLGCRPRLTLREPPDARARVRGQVIELDRAVRLRVR